MLRSVVFMLWLMSGSVVAQVGGIVKNKFYPSGKIDTIFIPTPRTYICLKNELDEYIPLPELNNPTLDTLYKSILNYFSDTVTRLPGFKPKNRATKEIVFTDVDPTEQKAYNDSLFSLMGHLHAGKIKKAEVPELFFQMMDKYDYDHMLLVFQYGFAKDNKLYHRQEVGAFLLSLLSRGAPFEVSQYHTELTCCILDRKTRSISFYGHFIGHDSPLEPATYRFALNWLFDHYLSKKKLIE